jgi:hypothetical protein
MIVTAMEDALKHTVPLPTQTSSVGPVPTVIPDDQPVIVQIHDTGKRTLW